MSDPKLHQTTNTGSGEDSQRQEVKSFEHYCTCGGFAWSMNGRPQSDPHMAWCPQKIEYDAWWRATHG